MSVGMSYRSQQYVMLLGCHESLSSQGAGLRQEKVRHVSRVSPPSSSQRRAQQTGCPSPLSPKCGREGVDCSPQATCGCDTS